MRNAWTRMAAAIAMVAVLGSEVRPASRPKIRDLKENNPTWQRVVVKFWRA